VIEKVELLLRSRGFRVARNRPYAGGHITARYGRPDTGVHALQIEVRRGLFMEERTREPTLALPELELVLREVLSELVRLMLRQPASRPLAAE
jgi:N-formylglutamate amidohydrolase